MSPEMVTSRFMTRTIMTTREAKATADEVDGCPLSEPATTCIADDRNDTLNF
jgi:hypothetical protein